MALNPRHVVLFVLVLVFVFVRSPSELVHTRSALSAASVRPYLTPALANRPVQVLDLCKNAPRAGVRSCRPRAVTKRNPRLVSRLAIHPDPLLQSCEVRTVADVRPVHVHATEPLDVIRMSGRAQRERRGQSY